MSAKQDLQKLIQDLETKKFRDGEAKGLVTTIGDEIKKQLSPIFEGLAKDMTGNVSKSVSDAVKGLKVDAPTVNMPAMSMPEMPPFPEMKAPIVNIPAPIVNVPKSNITVNPTPVTFPDSMSLKPGNRPFPVIMMDEGGKPMKFPAGYSGGATGGKADFFTILGVQNTVGVVTINPDGMPTYSAAATGAATSTQLVDSSNNVYSAANPLPTTATISLPAGQGDAATATRVVIAGNSDASVVVNSGTITTVTTLTGITNTVAAALVDSSGVEYSGSNPLPTTASLSLPAGQGDAATATRVVIAGNSDASVVVNSGTITTVTTLTGITNSVGTVLLDSGGVAYSGSNPVPTTASLSLPAGQGDAATATRVVIAGNSDASVVVNSGTITTVTTLTGVTNSIQVVQLDRDGNPWQPEVFGQGDAATALRVVVAGNSDASVVVNSGTITTVTTLTGITNTVAAASVDSSGVQYSGSNPAPINNTQWSGVTPTVGQNETGTGTVRVVHMTDTAISTVVNSGTITTVTTLTGITNTVAAMNVDSSGVGYSGSNPLPVTFTGSASSSVALVNSDGTYYNSANPFFITTAIAGLNETNANVARVTIMTDTAQSANITTFNGNAPATGLNETTAGVLRTTQMTDTTVSSNVVTFNGNAPATGLNETTSGALRVVMMSDTAVSVTSQAQGLNETTAGVLRITHMTDTIDSVNVVTFNGNAPATGLNETTNGVLRTITMSDTASSSQAKLIARTTLPTAASDASSVFQISDKYGREVNRPIQVRDLTATSYVSLSTGTEATFLAATAGALYDLVWVLMSNQSTAAVQVDVRPVLAGNILMTFQVPANGTVGIAPPVPLPGGADTGNAWTVDMPDITGTTVNITGLFTREI